ncbi:MAG: hypothetical protein DRI44_08490 [Chlamydiae bacterium]|nr:MAG: hypothetical protein DRI44_08490 [Chlamydiota bacterium]
MNRLYLGEFFYRLSTSLRPFNPDHEVHRDEVRFFLSLCDSRSKGNFSAKNSCITALQKKAAVAKATAAVIANYLTNQPTKKEK